MANLFGKNKIRSIAQAIDTDEVVHFIDIVKKWHHDYHQGTLKQDKETSREQEYNQNFFKDILGYKEKPATPFNFEPKATTEKGQLPDAVVGYTDKANDIKNISAVVELKGAAVDLDRPQQREGNMSPVQQAFKYKTQYRNCPFVIVSNFWEFRLYRDNLLDYEAWTLDDLVNPDDDYLLFKTWYVLLKSDNFITDKGTSKTENILSDIRIEQENISKKFYKVYKDARLVLLRDIYSRNETVRENIDMGVEKAQKIIDRIVFTCFAEDRGLLPDNTLQRVIRDAEQSSFGVSLWQAFKGLFEAIDSGSDKLEIPDGYNGGLFKHDEVLNNLRISDDGLKPVVELSKYDFTEDLSVSILGHIFEQSISDLEEIKNKVNVDKNIEAIITQSRRKKDGIFYTPDYIVRYIVDNSLGVYLREHEDAFKNEYGLHEDINDKNYSKREKQAYQKYQDFLQNIKVVDPACGSGAFLVYVFDYLMAENQRVGDILGNNIFSSDEYIRDILKNNIYGVDLNEESVEITKLSLWLKSAQKGKKLTSLDNNIKCGNSLIDDPAIAGNKAFNWQTQFSDVFKGGGFDVVVGNPPYVRQEFLGSQKNHFAKHYRVYSGTTDLFAYFYEKAVDILKLNGMFSYISNTFAKTTGAGIVLRKYLKENTCIEQIIDFNTLTIFDGATTYPIILVFRKTNKKTTLKYLHVQKEDLSSLDAAFRSKSFGVVQQSLNDSGWIFEDAKTAALRQKLAIHKTVKEQFGKSYYGVKTGLNEAFIISSETRKKLIEKDVKSQELIKPFLEGKDISRWRSFVEDKSVIYITQGLTKRFFDCTSEERALKSISEKYPAIIEHLLMYESQAKARYDKGDYWWEMRACAYEDMFDATKIVWPNLQAYGKFCFDSYPGKYINAPAVILPSNDESLLGILNSKLVWFFLSGVCVQRNGGYLEVKPQYFEQIPIPKMPEIWKETTRLKVESMFLNVKAKHISEQRFRNLICDEFGIEKWPTKINKWWVLDFFDFAKALKLNLSLAQKDDLLQLFEKYRIELQQLDAQIQKTDQEIDQLVYKLYNLTPEETKIIEGASL